MPPDSDEDYGLSDDESFSICIEEDEFPFSDDDEAALCALTTSVERTFSSTLPLKRPLESSPPSSPAPTKKPKYAYPTTSALARKVLQETWGYPAFRLQQEQAIARLMAGGSAVVVFPTGGGKSLVYQVPALALEEKEREEGGYGKGVTIVISPLIALMKDQVDALRARGVSAGAIDSSQSKDSLADTYSLLRDGELKLLYCAPERLNNEAFVEMIKGLRVRLIAVDEAHCISEWGQAFRPDYLKVARFVKEIGAERVLCLTATATPHVAQDILEGFGIPEDGLFKTTTYRDNLALLAESFTKSKDKMPPLKQFLIQNLGASIVYVTTQQQTVDVSAELQKAGINSLAYHAGMRPEQRLEVQDKFMAEENVTIVATIAFGMGIDKADIRNIVHYDFPRSLEGYSQEIGRAGRDGLPSICKIYLCAEDWRQREIFCRTDLPSKQSVRALLNELFTSNAAADEDDVIEAKANQQSKEWDIKVNTLALLYAQLELRFELLRAITPKYSIYTYKASSDRFALATSENSVISKTIIRTSTGRSTTKTVNVDAIAKKVLCEREEVVRKLQDWSSKGWIDLKPSGVVNRYRMIKPFPKDKAEREQLINTAYEQMERREIDDLRKSKAVIGLITAQKCFAAALADYFGDKIPDGRCGRCQWCETGVRVVMEGGTEVVEVPIDQAKVNVVLRATPIRDDPRFLAKIAFGVGSPRVTAERCGAGNPVFGSMAGCGFDALVEEFAKHCEECD